MAKCYQKEIPFFSTKIKEITNKKQNTKNTKNTNQQIIPTHNRDNENCDIADKRDYEVNLDNKYLLINFSCFQET